MHDLDVELADHLAAGQVPLFDNAHEVARDQRLPVGMKRDGKNIFARADDLCEFLAILRGPEIDLLVHATSCRLRPIGADRDLANPAVVGASDLPERLRGVLSVLLGILPRAELAPGIGRKEQGVLRMKCDARYPAVMTFQSRQLGKHQFGLFGRRPFLFLRIGLFFDNRLGRRFLRSDVPEADRGVASGGGHVFAAGTNRTVDICRSVLTTVTCCGASGLAFGSFAIVWLQAC